MINPLQGVNLIIAVGSVDGMAATAACLRHLNNIDIQIIFTQAFQVNLIDVTKWKVKREVGLIDLAVNNEKSSQKTIDFIRKIYAAGHHILFIVDEHDKKAWKSVLEECGHTTNELSIQPEDRTEYQSSCKILMKALGNSIDDLTRELLIAGHEGDQMNFATRFGAIFNNCTKSNPSDPIRRPYVVRHMAQNEKPDEKIRKWMLEYAELEKNHDNILKSNQDLGNKISRLDGTLGHHDTTTIFNQAYRINPIIVLKSSKGISIGTCLSDLNILNILQDEGITAGGMPAKANLALRDEQKAIEAIRSYFVKHEKL